MAEVLIEGPVPGEFEVQTVDLDPEDERDRVKAICEEIKESLRNREETEEKIWKVAVQQYKGELPREDAEPGESELDMPSTRAKVDMAAARFINTVFARPEIYLSKPRRPEAVDFARAVEELMDWAIDRTEFRFFIEDIVRSCLIFPKAVAKVPFVHKVKKVRDWGRQKVGKNDQLETHWGSDDKTGKLVVGTRYYTEEARPIPMVVPIADFIHPVPCTSIADAPWVVHRLWLSKDDIRRKVKAGLYREKTPDGDDIFEKLGSCEDRAPDQELSLTATKPSDSYGADLYEIWEIYTTYNDEETILTVEADSGTVLRWVYNFYFDFQRPFFTFCYERVPGEIDGISLCYILEPLHRARSACFNQRLDAASKAMETILLFADTTDLSKYFKDGKIRSGAYPVNATGNINEMVAQFNLNQPFAPIEGLEGTIERDMDLVASLTDYNAGLEQIQRPTASGQIALLEEGRQPMYSRMENLRVFLKSVGECMLSRYRQFFPDDLVYYIQSKSPEEQQMIQMVLQWPQGYWRDEIYLETAVSSQSMSRDLRKQEWLALTDKMPQLFQQLMGMIQQALTPGPMAPAAGKMMSWYMRYVVQPWLAEFEVAGREFLDFGKEMQIGQMFGQMLEQLQGEIQSLQGEVEAGAAAAEQARGIIDHLTRAFVTTTGKLPPPPPAALSRGQGGPPQAPPGMGGGPGVPGGGPPPEGPGGIEGPVGGAA